MGRAISEKTESLSKEVKDIIEHEPFIRNPLADGLVNYSALARKIQPRIEKRLNRKVKEESLIVAIKRLADELAGKANKPEFLHIFANSSLSMQDDISFALLNSKETVQEAIEKLLKNSDWHPGEVRIIVESPGRVAVVLKKAKMSALLKVLEKEEVLDLTEGNALVTMREPMECKTTYGIIAEIAAVLSKKGISIDLISATPDLHFMVHEKHGEETYKSIRELISTAKQTIQELKK